MKNVITIAAGLLLTTSAFASTVTYDNNTELFAGTYETKAQAFDAGFDLTDSLETLSASQLGNKLSVWAYDSVSNIAIDDTKVVVEEIASARDGVQYRAIVDVDYHFNAQERN